MWKEMQEIVHNFMEDRPILKVANHLSDRQFLVDEAIELLQEPDPVLQARELADVLFMVLSIADRMGVDLEAEFREKAARNLLKYQARDYQAGDYQIAREKSRAEWNDDDFYLDK